MSKKSKYRLPSVNWLTEAVQKELKARQPGYEIKHWLYPEDGAPAMILSPLEEKPYSKDDSPEEIIEASRPDLDIGINIDLLRRFYGKNGVSDPQLKLFDVIPYEVASPALFGYFEPVPGAQTTMKYWCGRFLNSMPPRNLMMPPRNLMILDGTRLDDASHVLLDITSKMVDERAWNAGGFYGLLFRPEHHLRPDERHIDTTDVEGFRREFIVLDLAETKRLGLFHPEYL